MVRTWQIGDRPKPTRHNFGEIGSEMEQFGFRKVAMLASLWEIIPLLYLEHTGKPQLPCACSPTSAMNLYSRIRMT